MLVEAKYLHENVKLQYKETYCLLANHPPVLPPAVTSLSLSPFYLLPFFYVSKLSPPPARFHSSFIATSSPCSPIPPPILAKGNVCMK